MDKNSLMNTNDFKVQISLDVQLKKVKVFVSTIKIAISYKILLDLVKFTWVDE